MARSSSTDPWNCRAAGVDAKHLERVARFPEESRVVTTTTVNITSTGRERVVRGCKDDAQRCGLQRCDWPQGLAAERQAELVNMSTSSFSQRRVTSILSLIHKNSLNN
jgi:hypothetical protein